MPGFIGVLGVLAFAVTTLRSRPFRGGVLTEGTVVGIETEMSRVGANRRPMRTYAPKVEYRDNAGTAHTVTSSMSGGVQPEIGAAVRISYRPEEPDRARILADRHTRVGSYLFLVVGLGFLAAAVFLRLR